MKRARYQRYVNVSDNRSIVVYGIHGSGAFDNAKSQRHDSLIMHTTLCREIFRQKVGSRNAGSIDQSPPPPKSSFILILSIQYYQPSGKF